LSALEVALKRGFIVAAILSGFLCCNSADPQDSALSNKRLASSREFAAVSASLLGKDPELALLIALEANQEARTAEAEDALRNSLVESRLRTICRMPAPANVVDADMSPDGRTIISAEHLYSEKTRISMTTVRWWAAATGRELRSVGQLSGSPYNIAFSSDGSRIILLQNSGIRLFDADSGKQIQEFPGNGFIDPDGRHFAFRQGAIVHVWDAATFRELFQFHSEYHPLLYSSKSGLVAMLEDEPTFHIWDASIGKYVAEFRITELHHSSAFSPDGKLLATAAKCAWGNNDPTVHIWDAKTGSSAAVLSSGCVSKVLFGPDGRLLFAAGEDGVGQIWDAKTWRNVSKLFGNASWMWSAAFSPDSRLIIAGGGDNRPRIWEAATGKIVAELSGHTGAIRKVLFTPPGDGVLTAADDGTVRLWDLRATLDSLVLTGLGARAWQGEFSQDGVRVLATGQSGTVLVWNARTGGQVLKLGLHRDSVTHAEFSKDGQLILTASLDGEARLWDAKTGKLIFEKDSAGKFANARLSPDGHRLVVRGGGVAADLWDVRTRKRVAVLDHKPDYVGDVAFDPGGKYVLSTCANCSTARIWDAATGEQRTKLEDHSNGTSFSPDSRYLVGAGASGTIHIWSVETGRIVATLKINANVKQNVAFTPDGRRIVACAIDGGSCSVWESPNWRRIAGFQGEADFGQGNLFSPDGRFVMTHRDETATMVEIATGKVVSRLSRQRAKITGAVLSADAKYAATFNEDGTTIVYPWEMLAPIDDLLALASKRTARTLSCEERRLYLHGPSCSENHAEPRP
jgi:WD40 repeat protein